MSDFSTGAIVDDDLDLSAAKGRSKSHEAVAAKTAAWGGKGLNAAIGVSAVIMVAGIVLWGVQLSGGMVQTGMRNLSSWGLYITSFMFFVGLSAGGLIISSVPKAFGIAGFGGISKVAVMSSIACTVAAIGMVVVDLGQPARLWELFAYSNLGSPLMWDIVVLGTYLILSCVYLWAQVRADAGKVSHTALRVISVVALVTAVLVHSVTAWIFGLQIAKEGWYSAIMAPIFVASAMDSGLALLLLALVFWLTLSGANTVSAMLSGFLLGLEAPLRRALTALSLPSGAVSLLTDGVWRVLATVVSVMLPPMAIFFPLFTLLEDAGYLPRIALQLDHAFCRAGACGKQSLSMCLRALRAQKNRTG